MRVFVLCVFVIVMGIVLSINADIVSTKRTYFEKKLNTVGDEDQKKTIQWYLKHLRFKVRYWVVVNVFAILALGIFYAQHATGKIYIGAGTYFGLVTFSG